MSHINKITIENFRQFDKLEIDNFKRINFIVGRNNCGKTSFLEALYWGSYPMNLHVLVTMHKFRQMLASPKSISALFLQKNEVSSISINIETKDKLKYGLLMTSNQVNSNNLSIEYENTEVQKQIQKSYNYIAIDNNKKYNFTFYSSQGNISFSTEPVNFGVATLYISNETKGMSTERLGNAVAESREDELLEYVQIFEPKVSKIVFADNNEILIEINESYKKYKLPLNLMGDGFIRYLSILVDMLFEKTYNEVILIDEIENGLHYSNIKHLLRAILTLSNKLNMQMFVTTHSYDTLKFLSEVMQEDKFLSQKEDIQIINMAHPPIGFKTYSYGIDVVEHHIEHEIEVR